MKVLFVNHTAQVSGGERSLLELVRALPASVTPIIASPAGPLADAAARLGVAHEQIPGTDGSLRLHPLHTPKAIYGIVRGALAVRAAAARHDVAVVHANSIRGGLFVAIAATHGGPRTVVHLRDRLPPSRLSRLTLRTIARADLLLANSRYTAESVTDAGVSRLPVVIGNPVDLLRFEPAEIDRDEARRELGLSDRDFAATVLAQITPWKGQEEAIRALALVRERHPHAKLLLVGAAKFVSGATRYDNRTYLRGLQRLVDELSLQESVRFLGEREDVPRVLRATDALLVPSWEEPFGRSIVEAMAMRVPVLATEVGGPSEIITDGRDGLLLPPRDPDAWASAIMMLIDDLGLREQLSLAGSARSRDFAAGAHAEAVQQAYGQACAAAAAGARPARRRRNLSAAA